ncbi:PREDICTED: complement component C8 gamma chain, partial [Myotis brandtii]|uniref:complement component C8 gamma chain n=1 Tax=Myotis brandtii TaxID=109478 RepID=UPI000703FC68
PDHPPLWPVLLSRTAAQGGCPSCCAFAPPRDGICWQVRQLYRDTKVPGRFLLRARGAKGDVHVVVGETDYQSFAILYLERARRLSVKLYARSLPVDDSVVSKFEQSVQGANMTEDHILYFPKYGFCEAADQFHVLDG